MRASWLCVALLVSAPCWANERYNRNWVASLSITHAIGDQHPWGTRMGVQHQFALRDHCGWSEVDCYQGPVWPVVGPAAWVGWRGGPRVAAELAVEGGAAGLMMAHFGYHPRWQALARAGVRVEAGPNAISGVLGAALSKSAGYDERVGPNATRQHGTHGIGGRLDLDVAATVGEGWRAPTLGLGPWIVTSGTGYLF